MGVLKQWLPYVLSGISAGGQYALIAVGYTMVYGILRLINFAHGDIFMVAGLIMVYLSATMPLYAALPAVVILTVALGFAVERCAYKPLRQAPCDVTRSVSKMTEIERWGGKRWDKPKKAGKSRDCRGGKF